MVNNFLYSLRIVFLTFIIPFSAGLPHCGIPINNQRAPSEEKLQTDTPLAYMTHRFALFHSLKFLSIDSVSNILDWDHLT